MRIMRTSYNQFETMLLFMEKHGDLSRLCDTPQGRVANILRWGELTTLLNEDESGGTKTAEKWRKTWSDLKNNTRRKATKIYSTPKGPNGKPATTLRLTEVEERVMAIMNPEGATGSPYMIEVSVDQDPLEAKVPKVEPPEQADQTDQDIVVESWDMPESSDPISQPGRSSPPIYRRLKPVTFRRIAPIIHRKRVDVSPRRRRVLTSLTELPRQALGNSDREWRDFIIVQERERQEIERERLRLKEIELQQQAKWQELSAQFLQVLEKVSDKLINK